MGFEGICMIPYLIIQDIRRLISHYKAGGDNKRLHAGTLLTGQGSSYFYFIHCVADNKTINNGRITNGLPVCINVLIRC